MKDQSRQDQDLELHIMGSPNNRWYYSKNQSTTSEVKTLLPESNNAIAALDETNTEDTHTNEKRTNTEKIGCLIFLGFIFLVLFLLMLSPIVFTKYIYINLKFQVDSLDITLMSSGYNKTNSTLINNNNTNTNHNNTLNYNGLLLNLTFSLNSDEIPVFFESPTVSVLHQGTLINSKTLDRFYLSSHNQRTFNLVIHGEEFAANSMAQNLRKEQVLNFAVNIVGDHWDFALGPKPPCAMMVSCEDIKVEFLSFPNVTSGSINAAPAPCKYTHSESCDPREVWFNRIL